MVDCNEDGFTRENVEAICNVGASTKTRNNSQYYIGEKSIGFKSVFMVASRYIFNPDTFFLVQAPSRGLWNWNDYPRISRARIFQILPCCFYGSSNASPSQLELCQIPRLPYTLAAPTKSLGVRLFRNWSVLGAAERW